MPSRSIRIVIADDHPIFRDGLRRLLDSEPGFEVVAEAADGDDAIQRTMEARPDVLLLDVSMPRLGGLDILRVPELADARVILLTAAIEPTDVLRAVQAGARGVVLKESATRDLIDGIHRVMDGKLLLAGSVADDLAHAVRQAGVPPSRPFGLTPREVEIVRSIAAGDSNRDIARRLDISLQTVKHHLTSVFDKTGTSTRLELALFALRNRIAEGE
ncbi:MAG: response regulator transcription factor [Vicinamibacterales bacterium]